MADCVWLAGKLAETAVDAVIFIYSVDKRRSLGKRNERSLTHPNTACKLIRHLNRAHLGAGTAARAGILINKTRILSNTEFEGSRLTFKPIHLRVH